MDRKAAYYEKLKDPRWQQLRLRVFDRDQWTCQICGSKDKTLHVHHARYQPGEPWETAIELLFTACADCHEAEHEAYREQLDVLLIYLSQAQIRTSIDLESVNTAIDIEVYHMCQDDHCRSPSLIELTQAIYLAISSFHKYKAAAIADGAWYYRRDA